MAKANELERRIAVDSVAIAKGQSLGKIPVEIVSSEDYVQSAISDARAKGASYFDLANAVRRGLTGRPNPSHN